MSRFFRRWFIPRAEYNDLVMKNHNLRMELLVFKYEGGCRGGTTDE